MHELHGRGRHGADRKQPDRQPVDDWLGDISDEDWSEHAATFGDLRRATPLAQGRAPKSDTERNGLAESRAQARPLAAEARRAAFQRRRAVAALVLLVLIALAGAAAVLLLRDETETPATTAPEFPVVATTTPEETTTTPSTTPTETTPAAPSENAATFTLPQDTKLQRGDREVEVESDLTVSNDPGLIADLQRALARAGYEPGSPDGIFGQSTEDAVVAFQLANGLSPDGIVGPETADALSRAAAGG